MLLITPRRAWAALNEAPHQPLLLAAYTAVLAFGLFVARSLGSALLGMGLGLAILEGALFTLSCVGATLAMGLALLPFARLARRRVEDGHAMKLATFSATPLWLLGVFQIIPVSALRTLILFASLGWACTLLFKGLPRLFQTEPTHTLVTALIVSAAWVIGLALVTQLLLPLAFTP